MLKNKGFLRTEKGLVLLLLFFTTPGRVLAAPADFNIDGVFEVALDLPHMYALLKREPNGPPLELEGSFVLDRVFLDTGASGILLSRETVDDLQISTDPNAQYSDVGVGGIEFFDVSEPLYIGTADYETSDPYDPNLYRLAGPWRFQVKQYYAGPWPDEPIELLGMPVMAGKTVVLNAGGPNYLYPLSADIKEPNDPTIPEVDFTVPLRFEKYIMPKDPNNIPPLPVLAYNPVIDNITVQYDGNSTTGSWLLDTGGTISLMAVSQAAALGITEPNGAPLIPPDFIVPVGGVGGEVNIPGFEIDNLIIPTLNGYKLIFNNARIGVYDIGIVDEATGELIILDGVFGSNFLCASAKINESGWPIDFAEGAFEKVVIDMQNGLLGFDVNDVYPLPTCGDPEHPQSTADLTADCKVNLLDLYALGKNWLRDDCNAGNAYCNAADINKNGKIDLADYALLAGQWLNSPFTSACGDDEHPWPQGDLNRDCSVDLRDIRIIAEEWLNHCDWLNWNCRGADLNSDKIVNLRDYAELIHAR